MLRLHDNASSGNAYKIRSAVFSYARAAATYGATGTAQSSSAAEFSPFVSAGVMF